MPVCVEKNTLNNSKLFAEYSNKTISNINKRKNILNQKNNNIDDDEIERKIKQPNDSKGKMALETMNEIVNQHRKFWKGKT